MDGGREDEVDIRRDYAILWKEWRSYSTIQICNKVPRQMDPSKWPDNNSKILVKAHQNNSDTSIFTNKRGRWRRQGQFFEQLQAVIQGTPKHDLLFSLLKQEYPAILTSGEMLSHPAGWDKPIPEVIHLWRHRTSTPNNLEKSRLGCVLNIFCTFLCKNEKNNQTPHWGRDSGIPSSCLRFATSTTRQASSWIANLRHSEGIPSSLPQCGVRFY